MERAPVAVEAAPGRATLHEMFEPAAAGTSRGVHHARCWANAVHHERTVQLLGAHAFASDESSESRRFEADATDFGCGR